MGWYTGLKLRDIRRRGNRGEDLLQGAETYLREKL